MDIKNLFKRNKEVKKVGNTWTKEEVKAEAKDVIARISNFTGKSITQKSFVKKEACITYCSIKGYAEPELKQYWEEVKDYIKYKR